MHVKIHQTHHISFEIYRPPRPSTLSKIHMDINGPCKKKKKSYVLPAIWLDTSPFGSLGRDPSVETQIKKEQLFLSPIKMHDTEIKIHIAAKTNLANELTQNEVERSPVSMTT